MKVDPTRVDSIRQQALDVDPAERPTFLVNACAGDQELFSAVETALRTPMENDCDTGAASLQGFLAIARAGQPSKGVDRPTAPPPSSQEAPLGHIGPYRLVRKLGEGGMGVVYLAEQEQPLRRQVAVKILKADANAADVMNRFEAERQALAMMDHPHIAKVFDAGTARPNPKSEARNPKETRNPNRKSHNEDDSSDLGVAASDLGMVSDFDTRGSDFAFGGRPYFVMELVQGLPVTQFCDQHRLSIRDRLELFTAICQAVHHAHQKGIIHRDLKPSNVLVEMRDCKPTPKVIDFGVAKAIGPKLTDATLHTEFGHIVGTLEYMAPEQARLHNPDIDTRADIYSLGVMLHELLIGSPPFSRAQLHGKGLDEMLRLIREGEPSRPSHALAVAANQPQVAVDRGVPLARLHHQLRGELDWIVLKALAKERDRRYESAASFAMDITRYLDDEPIIARPPSVGYRLHKFLRRHRGAVVAAALIFISLVIGVIVSAMFAVSAHRAANDERAAKVVAHERLTQLEKGNEFLGTLLRGVNPRLEAKGGPSLRIQLGERLKDAAAQLEGNAIGDSLTVARLQKILGRSQTALGYPEQAIEVLQKARATLTELLGEDHLDTLVCVTSLAEAYARLSMLDKAVPLFEWVRDRNLAIHGPEHDETLASINNLADAYRLAGRRDLSLPLFEQTWKVRLAKLGPKHLDTISSTHNLAVAYRDAGQVKKALPLFQDALDGWRDTLGLEHADALNTLNSLAGAHYADGRLDLALPLFEQTAEKRKKVLGADHLDTWTSINNLAMAWHASRQSAKALPVFEDLLAKRASKLGADHSDTLQTASNLALVYHAVGNSAKAISLLEETVARFRSNLGDDHPETLTCINNLAFVYGESGQSAKAIPLMEQNLASRRRNLGLNHPETLLSEHNLAGAYERANRWEEAADLYEKCFTRSDSVLGPQHPDTLNALNCLATAYQKTGKWKQAEVALRTFLDRLRAIETPPAKNTSIVLSELGAALLELGKFPEAEPILRECLSLQRQLEPKAWTNFVTQMMLGRALAGQRKFSEADSQLREVYDGLKSSTADSQGQVKQQLIETLVQLVSLHDAWGKPSEASMWRERLKASKGR